MATKSLNYADYKSAGIYFIEQDNSVIESIDTESLRLAVGFSKKGPYNVPVFLNSPADAEKYYGAIDTKAERRGSFFQRSLNTLTKQAPVFALNLLSVDERDKSQLCQLSVQADKPNEEPAYAEYSQYFDRSKFWVVKPEKVLSQALGFGVSPEEGNVLNIANVGTKDFTVFVRKAENLRGYKVTVKDFYGAETAIPYAWMNPSDLVEDYFLQVIVVEGIWGGEEMLKKLAKDTKWSLYFTEKGLKKDVINKFLNEDAIHVIGNWTGTIIPDFYAKNGQFESIEPIINQSAPQTGFAFSLNEDLLSELGSDFEGDWYVDLVGHNLAADASFGGFLSYPASDAPVGKTVATIGVKGSAFAVQADAEGNYDELTIGSLVKDENGKLARVIKKEYYNFADASAAADAGFDWITSAGAVYIFKCTDNIAATEETVYSYKKLTEDEVVEAVQDAAAEKTQEEFDAIVPSANSEEYIKVPVANSDPVSYEYYHRETSEGASTIEMHYPISEMYDALAGIVLKGLEINERHMPGYDADGQPNPEAGLEKVYKVLTDTGIWRGLTNTDGFSFRYIIDTMGYGKGQGLGGKKYLSMLAKEVGSCTAILSYPSMSYLADSLQPIFRDIDAPQGDFDTKYIPTGGNPDAIGAGAVSLPSEDEGSKNTGVFAPYLRYTEGSRNILVPPAADVANAYMRKFSGTGDPYVTVANMNGVLSNSSLNGVEYQFDKVDRDNIEPYGINPIIQRNGQVLIYGDKTAYQDVISDYNYLHVRELLNTIEISVRAILHPYIFKYNNAETRAEIVRKVTPILQAMQDSGALYSFEIQMDENNNTPEVIERSYGILDIGVRMGKNLEKIVTRIKVNRLSA